MASINRLRRELLFKIVFYGPGLGGKTTTLQHIHAATKPENRGNMVSLATDADRTLYFDYAPISLMRIGDVGVKLQLYTVPGQVYYSATRKLVLSGADGIVFVADSQAARSDANLESLEDLNTNLAEQGRKLSAMPHAFQWNKRDLADVIPTDELDRRLNLFAAAAHSSVATTGEGVFEVLERITRAVVDAYRAELPMPSGKGDEVPLFLDAEEVGLADAIKELADSQPARSPKAQASPAAASPPAPAMIASAGAAARSGAAGVAGAAGSAAGALVAAAPSAQANAIASQASPGSAPRSSSRMTPPPATTAGGPFSLCELWPSADRDSVRRAEQLLAMRDAAGAVGACEDVLSRTLAAGSVLLGGQANPRDPAIVATLLGLDGARYLAFRHVARGVRSKREPTLREALECYAFALEARRALDRAVKGS
jgi:signal recognition particle receptor subunit beta